MMQTYILRETPANNHSLLNRMSDANPLVQMQKTIWSCQSGRLMSRLYPGLLKMSSTHQCSLLHSRRPKTSWKISLMTQKLLNNSRCLQFPDCEWSNLIMGRAIDLDHILAGQYTISYDEICTERFGDVKFVVSSDKPAKIVNDHEKWVTTWDITVQAILFVFPHSVSELTNYGIHIKSLFGVLPSFIYG